MTRTPIPDYEGDQLGRERACLTCGEAARGSDQSGGRVEQTSATGPPAERGPVRRSGPPASLTPTGVSPTTTTEYEQHHENDQYSLHGHSPSPPANAVRRVTTSSNLVAGPPACLLDLRLGTCTFAASPSASTQLISNPWDLGPIVLRLANRLTSLRIEAQEAL